jgi:hypothetical protein
MCLCTVRPRDISFHILRTPTFTYIEQDSSLTDNKRVVVENVSATISTAEVLCMRLLIFLGSVLGLFVFLTVQYSFWVAFGVMELGGMLATAVIAFAVRGRQPFTLS